MWAGSAQFDEFDTSFVGREGNVLQGWGLYGSADKNVADWYRLKEIGYPKTEGGLYRANYAKSSDFIAWESTTQSPQVKAVLKVSRLGTAKKSNFNFIYAGRYAKAKAPLVLYSLKR